MFKRVAFLLCSGSLCLALSTAAFAEDAKAMVQRVVNSERTANQNDHSNWVYLEDLHKPKEHTLQWVAATQHGEVRRAEAPALAPDFTV